MYIYRKKQRESETERETDRDTHIDVSRRSAHTTDKPIRRHTKNRNCTPLRSQRKKARVRPHFPLRYEMNPRPQRRHLAVHILRGNLRGPSADCSPHFGPLWTAGCLAGLLAGRWAVWQACWLAGLLACWLVCWPESWDSGSLVADRSASGLAGYMA